MAWRKRHAKFESSEARSGRDESEQCDALPVVVPDVLQPMLVDVVRMKAAILGEILIRLQQQVDGA